jgi:predicted Zn finger-like uncharacterized protein
MSGMILTCPECATRYSVPDGSIGADGRKVRCQSCAHVWRAGPNDEPLELTQTENEADAAEFGRRGEALADAPAPELPRAFRARAEQQRRLRRAAATGAVWAGLASVFVALLGAAWLFRVDVVDIYPRAAAAYAAVGMPVNPTGLEFEAISARAAPNATGRVLVSGALRNVRDRETAVPTIRVALLDADGAEIGHQLVTVPGEPVQPGAVAGFATLIDDPGARAADVGLTFVRGEAAVVRAASLSVAETEPEAGHSLRPALGVPAARQAQASDAGLRQAAPLAQS